MWTAAKELDRLLRGDVTRPVALRDGMIDVPTVGLSVIIAVLALFYGACMGSYSLFKEIDSTLVPDSARYWQLLASSVKVPLLFFLTLVVTFPSLYVFNALVGSRLRLLPVLQLLIASLGVTLAVLASLGPIVAFFSVSTKSYNFMVLFNVLVFTVAGVLGLVFLVQTLNRLSVAGALMPEWCRKKPTEQPDDAAASSDEPSIKPSDEQQSDSDEQEVLGEEGDHPMEAPIVKEPGALDAIEGNVLGQHVKLVFRCWMVVFGLVGAQMGWVLRPFIGNPNQPFQWFRERESNFFQAVFHAFTELLSGSG